MWVCGSTISPPHVDLVNREQGLRFTPGGIRKGGAGYDVCFVHPKGNEAFPLSSEGVLVELVQAPESVINAYKVLAEA